MANILLLEDDESLNRGISLKLQKEGYQVFSAFGVTEAKQIFGSQKIDLIISDITMKAVSYTHLDVYKRQSLLRYKSIRLKM